MHHTLSIGALGLLLALAACGGGGDAPADPAPPAPPAGNAVRGRAIYQTICINCHAANPVDDRRGLHRASSSTILHAVQAVNQMRFLRDTIGAQEAADLESWLANPV
ncbi:MAG TPA: hypothetical protein VGE70_11785 [Burkholderiaceae bacterium]